MGFLARGPYRQLLSHFSISEESLLAKFVILHLVLKKITTSKRKYSNGQNISASCALRLGGS